MKHLLLKAVPSSLLVRTFCLALVAASLVTLASAYASGSLAPWLGESASATATVARPWRDSARTVAVQAAGRGAPWLGVEDGIEVPTGASKAGTSAPLALVAADFDEDGVQDLVGGYAGGNGGIVTVARGNVDALYPNAPEAQTRRANGTYTDAPFLAGAREFALAATPELLAVGDFDADGHMDVVAARKGENALYWMRGDGHGALGAATKVDLDGKVTTLASGEIDVTDGLDDLVVGLSRKGSAELLLFRGTKGAMNADFESVGLPGPATSITFGQFDNKYERDLAVAAGGKLVVVHGRAVKRNPRLPEPAARFTETLSTPFQVAAVQAGNFTGGRDAELALLDRNGAIHLWERAGSETRAWGSTVAEMNAQGPAPLLVRAKVSSLPHDDLIVVDPASQRVRVLFGDADPERSSPDAPRVGPNSVPVDLDVDGAPVAVVSMRLNSDVLGDLVVMRRGSAEPVAITTRGTGVTVNSTGDTDDNNPGNGLCDDGLGNCTLRAAITESNANSGSLIIDFAIGSGPRTITPASPLPDITDTTTIDATTQPGFSGTPIITLNGSSVVGTVNGFTLQGGDALVRGFVVQNWEASGFSSQTAFSTLTIEGNYIGTNAAGTAAAPNGGHGVDASGSVFVGGTTAAARNVISGNGGQGVLMTSGASDSSVVGNYIGTDATGTTALGNTFNGIETADLIGGTIGSGTGGGNVISGNTASGSASNGIYIHGSESDSIQVQNNYIGLNAAGTAALGNSAYGVLLEDTNFHTIGGGQPGLGNVISGNGSDGIHLDFATGLLAGNRIGTNAAGTAAIGNAGAGVSAILCSFMGVEGNVISGNSGQGVNFNQTTSSYVFACTIGLSADLSTEIPNAGDGIRMENESQFGFVDTNIIESNNGNGVTVIGSDGVGITNNSIFDNALRGIDLDNDGVTANDVGDGDGGANGRQNFPVITASSFDGKELNVAGTLNSTPNESFFVELFLSPSGDTGSANGEGKLPLGLTQVDTDPSGNASFNRNFPGFVPPGAVVTATASSTVPLARGHKLRGEGGELAIDETSEFSAFFSVLIPSADLTVTASGSPNPVMAGQDVTYTITVENIGSEVAFDVVLDMSTPPNTTFQSFDVPDAWIPTTPAVGGTGPIMATFTALTPSDGPQVFTLVVRVNPGTPGGFPITLTPSVSSDSVEADPSNNSDSATVLVQASADLAVAISDAPDPVAPDANITYTITATNNGPNGTTVNLSGSTPPNTTFVSGLAPQGWECSFPPAGATGSIVCAGGLSSGGGKLEGGFGSSAQFTIVVKVDAGTPDATVISNMVTVSGSNDPVPGNNTATAQTTVSSAAPSQADLGVTKSASPDPVLAGDNLTYTITVTNNGPAAAQGVNLNDSVPANTTFVSASAPPGWTTDAPSAGGTGPITFMTPSLAPNAAAVFTIVVRVNSFLPVNTVITNTATVSATGTADPNPSNDSATADVPLGVPATADVSLLKLGTPDMVTPGSTITYTLTASNAGPSPTTNVAISDSLPSNVTFVSAAASTGGTVTMPSVGSSGTVRATWAGTTGVDESRTLTIVVRVNANVPNQTIITNTASVTSDAQDVDLSNNQSSASTTVTTDPGVESADLSITTSAAPSEVDTGTFVTYTIAVRNNGPGTAEDVQVSGSTPDGTRLVSIDSTQGNASGTIPGDQGAFTVNIGDIEANQTVTITLVVNVIAPGGATFFNTVVVSSGTNDPDAADNTSITTSTSVVAGNDVLLQWDPPLPCPDDCLNPPLHLQTFNATTQKRDEPYTGYIVRDVRNTVIGYNIYRSNNPNVMPTPSNFFTSVPPGTTTIVLPTAPGGSFFTVTAQYPNGESDDTNAASGGLPEPTITGVQIKGNKLIVLGTGFTDNVTVFVDGIPFFKGAKVKQATSRVQQKGKLLTGQTVRQYVTQQGGVVLVSVLNADTGIGTFLVRP